MKTAPAAIAASLALALVVGGCATPAEQGPGEASPSSGTPSETPSAGAPSAAADASTASPEEAELLHPSADEVADQVAAVMWASDIRTDDGMSAAAARATEWLTPQLAQTVTQPVPAGAEWLELVEHEGTLVPEVVDVDEGIDTPADTETSAVRTRLVTLTPAGRDGWVGEPRVLVATFTLVREEDGGPWLVDALTVDESLNGTPDGDSQDFG